MTRVTIGLALGGLGAAVVSVLSPASGAPAPAPPPTAQVDADVRTPEGLAAAVVDRLNRKDLDGVIQLTCAQGRTTGRRELTRAIPALDPRAAPDVRAMVIEFELREVEPVPEGYRAAVRVRHEGVDQPGTMRIQRDGETWALCGMESPRVGGNGLLGSG